MLEMAAHTRRRDTLSEQFQGADPEGTAGCGHELILTLCRSGAGTGPLLGASLLTPPEGLTERLPLQESTRLAESPVLQSQSRRTYVHRSESLKLSRARLSMLRFLESVGAELVLPPSESSSLNGSFPSDRARYLVIREV